MSRALCPRCERPPVVCYCAHIVSVETRTRVLFLQHPREHGNPIGTVRIARLCLPNSELRVGVDFADDPVVRAALMDPERPAALLFPGPEAVDLREAPPDGPITLVVLDGTWSQAAKLLKLNPALRALPQYRLEPSRPSQYRIRREPAEHCVATIEAISEVLGVLEGDPARLEVLRRPFEAMVDRQVHFATHVRGARMRYAREKREPRPRPIPSLLRERPDDVVLVYGEANAWPFDAVDAPPPELVHWVARRPSTGEMFEAVIAPSHALAPSIAYHTGLPRERLLEGEARGEFLSRWSAFLRPDDVLCTWGSYATDVLAREDLAMPARLDLRAATSMYLGARTGALEDCAVTLGASVPAPLAAGRAGRRLAALSAIADALSARARS